MIMASLNVFCRFNSILNKKNVFNFNSECRRNITKVGFIGLGNMGKPMAKNLLKNGFNVTVYDINADVSNSLCDDGATLATNVADAASNADCVVTMLPDNDRVFKSYSDSNGIINNARKGTILIDSSTVDPEVPLRLAPLAEKNGAIFLDAPVSGGVMGAQSGQLTFMVGGPKGAVKKVDKVLNAMGKNIIHCGSLGSGQVTKICNNMLMAITMVGVCEAMNLGIRLGIEPKLLASVFNISSGRCWASEVYNPVPGVLENVPSAKNYQGGFNTKLLVKDLKLANSIAERSSSSIPFGKLSSSMFELIATSDKADNDFSIVYEFIKNNKLKKFS